MDTDDSILDLIGLLIVLGLIAGVGILVAFGGQTGPGNPQPEPPDANWSTARINATHVQVGHVGGDGVDANSLVVTVDGEERASTWDGQIERGDIGLVRAEEGSHLELYWTGDPRAERLRMDNLSV